MTLVIALLLLGFLVFIHELGHFLAAKIAGMRVETFSIGMGPAIAKIRRGETDYIFGLIPAGGYVAVAGIAPDEDGSFESSQDDPSLYQNKSLLQRAFYAAAGPAMNILLTIVILFGMYSIVGIGEIEEPIGTVIGDVAENSPAEEAGIQVGDKIVAVDHEPVKVWEDIPPLIKSHENSDVSLEISANGQTKEVTISPSYNKQAEAYTIGIMPKFDYHYRDADPKEAMTLSLTMTKTMSTMILDAVKNLVTGEASISSEEEGLTGPVGIVKVIDSSVEQGIAEVFFLLSILSINLGLLNLLPIPALDGSRLLFLLIEALRGRPVSPQKEGFVNFIGFVFLMFLMIYVTFNDISNLF